MGGKSRGPSPPSPQATAAAQTGTNVATAIANAQLANIAQRGPLGTLRYEDIGTYDFVDPTTGSTHVLPLTEAVTELSPEQQALFENLQGAAIDVSGRLGDEFTLGDEATESRLFDLGRQRLDPVFDQRRQSLEQQLANQGVLPGSEAYNRAVTQLQQQETDAYNQLLLTGRGQAIQEQIAEQTLPINELAALLSGQQVTTPQFGLTAQPSIPTTDYAGLVQQNYQGQLAQHQAQQQQRGQLLGGLFGLGGSLLGAFSDRRLKKSIRLIGKLANGLNIYRFKYIFGGPEQVGVMAQEVLKVHPEAVSSFAGFLTVDYSKLGGSRG